jgi:Pentapeptide repeats (8 copies)
MYALVALAVIPVFLLVLGVVLWVIAWQRAGGSGTPANTSQANRAQLLGALAAGVLTGAFATVAVLLLQQWLSVSSADTVWRANVETAADIPGFTPGQHSLQGLNLSGKQLEDANLSRADLRGVQMQDTDLRGAYLGGAKLQGDNMIGANLASAELPGANLSGAQLQAARFDNAYVEKARFAEFKNGKWIRAIANASTCWPQGFLETRRAKQIRMGPDQYYPGLSRGIEQPHCLPTHWPASVLR